MKRGRGGARPGAGRISDRSKDLATHYTTEAVPESASKRLKCKHCDWHEQGVKLDRFEGHMRASHGNLLALPKESIHMFVRPVDSTDLKKKNGGVGNCQIWCCNFFLFSNKTVSV